MRATINLTERNSRQLAALADREGTTAADLLHRIVEAYLSKSQADDHRDRAVSPPMIPASETGTVRPVSGTDLDDLLLRGHLSA